MRPVLRGDGFRIIAPSRFGYLNYGVEKVSGRKPLARRGYTFEANVVTR
jgi:hypothetical protein